ncbi:MAG: F420-dependent NADP oxidoreductase [Muribaculaceae bacterium]|nr:F420-dependent NADP oxidoreductase [Muribaculaceae bacterium]
MVMKMVPKIVFIGSGNVATHLAPAIEQSGAGEIVQVYSRNIENAQALASKLKFSEAIDDFYNMYEDADIYILSIKDDCIADVINNAKSNEALWLHTSGSVGMEILSSVTKRYGVFYPMQTFSKYTYLDMADVPLFIEGVDSGVEREIRTLAEKVFKTVIHADSELRRKMHIAAVFCCNFTNYMWVIADKLLHKEGLSIEVMKPLIEETIRKALANSPENGQTGPAVRGDIKIMEKHEAMLSEHERMIYRLLSESIFSHFNPQKKWEIWKW